MFGLLCSENPYLEESLRSVIGYCGVPIQGWRICIELSSEGGLYFVKNGKQTKTGFGSSSTTVIATVTSLLLCFGVVSLLLLARTM